MSYTYGVPNSNNRALKRHGHLIFLFGVLLVLAIAGYFAYKWYISQDKNDYKPKTGLESVSFHPLNTFKSPYFSFQADKSWKFIKEESSAHSFVYRSFDKNIVKRDLTVYVDRLPKNLLLTRVLPVEADGNRFITGEISEHCREYLKGQIQPGNNDPIKGVIDSVNIDCQIDGTSYTVGTGQKNGSYQTPLSGPGDSRRDYYLLYHDLEFNPQSSSFLNIVNSFRAK